jgi:NAD(P)-dependent dehydrogenase (short-subunit alcohol dehydrogenase family)
MSPERSVLITGASTGIGRACAVHMDRLGWRVFAGIRQESDAASLRSEGSERLIPALLDVADAASIRDASTAVDAALGADGLSGLINNAGVAFGGPIEYLDLDEMRRTFEVNFFGLIAVTQAVLPLLRRGHGRIVNMSSISGWIAAPFLSPYNTSKFALEALSDALRVELHPWDIRVAVIEPGAIHTPIWDKGKATARDLLDNAPAASRSLYGKAMQRFVDSLGAHGIQAEVVARAAAHALTSRSPKTRYAIGPDAAAVRLFRFLPDRLRDRFFLSRPMGR